MAFDITQPYTLVMGAMGAPSACQQSDEFYAVRVDLPTTAKVGPIPCVWLGPYATVQEAVDQYPNLPPPVEAT